MNCQNGGAPAARNTGLDVATGDYIAFVDADDIIEPLMYETMLRKLKNTDADILVYGISDKTELHNDYQKTEKNEETEKIFWRDVVIYLLDSDSRFNCSVWNKLYRKEVFDGIRFTEVRGEDFIIHYQLLNEKKLVIAKITAPFYHYIKRESSVTTGNLRVSNFQFMEVLYDLEKQEADSEFLKHWKIQKAISARNLLIRIIVSESFEEKFDNLRNDMVSAKFILLDKKYNYIDKSLKTHILIILLSPDIYRMIIKKKIKKG